MRISTEPPARGWSFIVEALAELGAREIERRERAAQQAAEQPRRDDDQAQPDQPRDAQVSEARG